MKKESKASGSPSIRHLMSETSKKFSELPMLLKRYWQKLLLVFESRELSKEELRGYFQAPEGGINLYYGRIGNGKTYNATSDIFALLAMGRVVYCNWHIDFQGFDERDSLVHVFFKWVGWRRYYFVFPKDNLHYFSPDELDDPIAFLSDLTDCDVFIDEGQWIFDSYEGTKFSKAKRRLILHTRHYNRSLNIITQRTQAIQVSARGQVNRFYKCEKRSEWPFLIFKRTEYSDMSDNDVDESEASIVSKKTYFARKKIMMAYDTHALRDKDASQEVQFRAYSYNFFARTKLLLEKTFALKRKRLPSKEGTTLGDNREVTSLKIARSPSLARVVPINRTGSIRPSDEEIAQVALELPF